MGIFFPQPLLLSVCKLFQPFRIHVVPQIGNLDFAGKPVCCQAADEALIVFTGLAGQGEDCINDLRRKDLRKLLLCYFCVLKHVVQKCNHNGLRISWFAHTRSNGHRHRMHDVRYPCFVELSLMGARCNLKSLRYARVFFRPRFDLGL